MTGRRRDTEDSLPAATPFSDAAGDLLDLLSVEGREQLDSFSAEDRALFSELLEDAQSELQQEFLRRALASRHSPKELHAFADQIRGLDDEALYDACTLSELGPGGARRGVVQRMRAEADPIYGFTLNGHSLTGDGDASGFDALGLPVRPRAGFSPPAALIRGPGPEELSVAKGRALRDLGESDDAEPSYSVSRQRPAAASRAPSTADELFTQAVAKLGYAYREVKIDPAAFPVGKALEGVVAALKKGMPVPAVLSNLSGNHRRYVLFLQANPGPRGHALQVHEPHSNDTVWVNEQDLKGGRELPLQNKALRRLSHVVLPRTKGQP